MHPFSFSPRHATKHSSERDRATAMHNPTWGRVFSDHMATAFYDLDSGWHDDLIKPRESFNLEPGAMVFHYALEIFEGLKAYCAPDGGALLFRPQANARRLNNSAVRLAMPPVPEEMFMNSVEALIKLDRDWISSEKGASLYLRPFVISTEAALGIKPSEKFMYSVIASPVTSFFQNDVPAVTVWISDDFIRAAPGGTGAAKCGGNYASGLAAQVQGRKEGCDQVVFLDAIERRWIEEFGAMNAFFVFRDGSLQTPPLTGTILPGITRDSLITLARGLGHVVREEPYSIDQWQADAASGNLTEAFACGTAAVVTPVGNIKGRSRQFSIGNGKAGPVTRALKKSLTDIQFGLSNDPYGWVHRVF